MITHGRLADKVGEGVRKNLNALIKEEARKNFVAFIFLTPNFLGLDYCFE